jgi:hypothetical protein
MPNQILPGTMMMREGILLPDAAQVESQSYSSAWRTLTSIDSFAFDRRLSAAGLHLFFVPGKVQVLELGQGASAVRRGVKRILARVRKLDLNCLQVTKIEPTRILGLPCLAIHANSFHIQSGRVLQSSAQRRSEQNDRLGR